MSEFEREQRYAVFKLSDMDGEQMKWLSECIARLPRRQCVVVEAHWPEYDSVWRMIERRVTGSPAPSRLEMKHVMQALDQVRGRPVLTSNQCHDLAMLLNDYLPIEDDAQSELAALREELAKLKQVTNFSDAVACVFDMLKYAACNTSDKQWDDQLEDLAEDVIEFAPEYKKQWKDIGMLSASLTAAEQRNATLVKAATEFMEYAESGWDHFPDVGVNLRAALQPIESGASE